MVNLESSDYPLTTKISCTIIIEVQTYVGKSVNFALEAKRFSVDWGDGEKDSKNTHTYQSEEKVVIEIKGSGFTHFTLTNNECHIDYLNIKAKTLLELNCSRNAIYTLDISECYKIKYIDCSYNRLPQLDLIRQKNLYYLECGYNKLTKLDLSFCPKLIILSCPSNLLKILNITNCNDLNTVDCRGNELGNEEINNIFDALPFQSLDTNATINFEMNPGFLHCDINKLIAQNWHVYKEI